MINDLWYKNAIIYCLSVGTYMDANGDGIGDFQGLMRRLDYLHGLGVTAIWLMPFQTSPSRDDGYDVADYYNVDPRYGTLGDFVEFTHGAKQRGIRVHHRPRRQPHLERASLVPGGAHAIRTRNTATGTSGRRRSRRTPTRAWSSPACRRRPGPTTRWRSAYYFHRFYDFQPDLNTANPQVQAEILKIMGFWIQLGVSGFRMDAVPFVIAHQGRRTSKKPDEQYDMLRTFREFLQWRAGRRHHPRRGQRAARHRHGVFRRRRRPHADDVQFPGQPDICSTRWPPPTRGRSIKALKATKPRPATAQWGLFLRNHDELDLGRLSDEAAPGRVRRVRARARTCSSTSAASGAGSRRCWTATGAASSLPTA